MTDDAVAAIARQYAKDFLIEFPWMTPTYHRCAETGAETAFEELSRWFETAIEEGISTPLAELLAQWHMRPGLLEEAEKADLTRMGFGPPKETQ